MEKLNRRSVLTLGAAAAAGMVALPLTSPTASADEVHRWRHIHEAYVALKAAKVEIESTGHDWGGQKREAIEAIDRAMVHMERLRDWK